MSRSLTCDSCQRAFPFTIRQHPSLLMCHLHPAIPVTDGGEPYERLRDTYPSWQPEITVNASSASFLLTNSWCSNVKWSVRRISGRRRCSLTLCRRPPHPPTHPKPLVHDPSVQQHAGPSLSFFFLFLSTVSRSAVLISSRRHLPPSLAVICLPSLPAVPEPHMSTSTWLFPPGERLICGGGKKKIITLLIVLRRCQTVWTKF